VGERRLARALLGFAVGGSHTSATLLRERSQTRSGFAVGLLLALVGVTGGSFSDAAATGASGPAAAASASSQTALVGTWRVTTCTELVTGLRNAGLKKFVLEFVAGNGFIPGITRPDQIKDPTHPCKGAVPRRHSHFFTRDRRFGSLDWRGRPVDDGTFRLVNSRTVVIFKEFPEVTFHFRIRANRITFAPVISQGCSTFRCAWANSMAYPGKTWQRAG
jgi:hypothetical protein